MAYGRRSTGGNAGLNLKAFSAADWVSLSRIPLALVFVLMFRAEPGTMLTICVAAAVIAQLSDHVDGFLARRRGIPPATGWLFDSIPDRAFHVAALLAFQQEYGLAGWLVWGFVLREMGVYALWIAVGDFEEIRPGFRPLGLIHAGLIRLAIALGCALPYRLAPAAVQQAGLTIMAALVAASTLFGFYCLLLVVRANGLRTAVAATADG
jgi:phosphatidylglycerophosphate synthase